MHQPPFDSEQFKQAQRQAWGRTASGMKTWWPVIEERGKSNRLQKTLQREIDRQRHTKIRYRMIEMLKVVLYLLWLANFYYYCLR
jgi:hypothetical protein